MTTRAELKRIDVEESAESLRSILARAVRGRNGLIEVYCVLKHVSRSGMSRSIKLEVICEDSDGHPYLQWLPSHHVASALDWREDRQRDAVKVEGVGMDIGFHLVNSLASVLYGRDDRGIGKALVPRWI